MNPFEKLVEALEQLTEAWRRCEIGCPDPLDCILIDEELFVPARAALEEAKRWEVVEGVSGSGPLGYGFLSGPINDGERPALLLITKEANDE